MINIIKSTQLSSLTSIFDQKYLKLITRLK